jgi:hypothetical protein
MNSAIRAVSLIAFTSVLVSATPITIFNTGVDNSGNALPAGSIDSHYAGISPASTAFVLGATTALPGTWLANSAASQWIGPDDGNGGSVNGGLYSRTYRTTFDLTGLIVATAQLTGRWAVDNSGTLLLNGIPISTATGFSSFTPFSASSGFVAGVNTLDAVWTNAGGPGGVLIEVSGTADQVPEPGTALLMFAGGLLVFARLFAQRRELRCSRN